MTGDLTAMVNRLATETIQYRQMAIDAAKAEAAHKHGRGRFLVKARAAGHSMAACDAMADADDDCAGLLMQRLTTAAVADSQRELLRSLRETIGAARTEIVNLRVGDELVAKGYGGSA